MRCKNCGWGNPDENSKCEKCGALLSESATEFSSEKYQSTENFDPRKTAVGCPKCGYPLRASDQQCPNCDEPVGGKEIQPIKPTRIGGTVIQGIGENNKPADGKKLAGFLVSYSNNPLGDYFPVLEGRNYIGRDDSATIRIQNDSLISGKHISILYRSVDKKFKFRDEQSSNGSFVNEKLIDEGELKNLDVIRIGSTRLLFIAIPQF
jgi:hypothetical protein